MNDLLLGLGSNRGERLLNLLEATRRIQIVLGITLHKVSLIYETEAWGIKEQDLFLNQVIWLKIADQSPIQVLHTLKGIEVEMGRKITEKWGPRVIDIDILYFGSMVYKDSELTVPHHEIAGRMFVLAPLSEIAPDFIDPVSGLTVLELKNSCHDPLQVRIVKPA